MVYVQKEIYQFGCIEPLVCDILFIQPANLIRPLRSSGFILSVEGVFLKQKIKRNNSIVNQYRSFKPILNPVTAR